MHKATLALSLLLSLTAGCLAGDSEPTPTKDEVRNMPAGKTDHVDWCDLLDWYDDGVCDEFCTSPDPDCGLVCEEADCGIQPEFQPRICQDGTMIFPSGTCDAGDDGTCGWSFKSESCPEDLVCEEADCGIQPEFQPRICQDGSSVFPSGSCEASNNGSCGWKFTTPDCPEDAQQ